MAGWKFSCKEFKDVRKMLDNGESDGIIRALLDICKKYASIGKWDFSDDFESFAWDLEEVVDDELEEEDLDFYLSEFYDLCDAARIWLEV